MSNSKNHRLTEVLDRSMGLLEAVFDSTNYSILILEAIYHGADNIEDYDMLMANRAVVEMLHGNSPVGHRYTEFFPGVIEAGIFHILNQVMRTGEPADFEQEYRGDNINGYFRIIAKKVDEFLIITFEDITERKKAERQLKQTLASVELQNKIFAHAERIANLGTWMWNPNTNEAHYSDNMFLLFGMQPQEVDPDFTNIPRFIHPEDRKRVLQLANDLTEGKEHGEIEYRIIRKDGELRTFCNLVKLIINEKGERIFIGTTQDITGQKKVEEEIIKQHNILKQAEELAGAGSWEYNVSTKEFLWSDGMYELFKIKKGSLVAPAIYLEHTIEQDKSIAGKIVSAIVQNPEPFEETLRIDPGGRIRILKIKGAPLKNDKGEIEKILGVDIDITVAQQYEERVMELNKSLVTMNRELSYLNSELKNFSIIAANNYSETLRLLYINLELIVTNDARNLSNSGRANLRRAQAAIQKMKLLTDDINKYLQLYDLGINKTLIDPNVILQDLLNNMKTKIDEARATIELSRLPFLPADPLLFSFLMNDLIDNAIKFRKLIVAPVIKIKYSHADELNTVPKALRDTGYIIISVSDNGIGFKEEDAEKILELFSRLENEKGHYKGSGIGLAVCKKIMEMHGGFIVAEGQPAQGASVYCYFPVN